MLLISSYECAAHAVLIILHLSSFNTNPFLKEKFIEFADV